MAKTDLKELGDFLDPILSIPYKDKHYNIPAMDAQTAARMEKTIGAAEKAGRDEGLSAADIELVSDDDTESFYASMFGQEAFTEMQADNVKHVALKHFTALVFAWTFADFDTAQEMWRAEGKAPAPNREARRTGTPTQQGGDDTTRPQDYRSTTKSKKAGSGKKS